jgi:hypothetical protein
MRLSGILTRISRHADLFDAMTAKLGVRDRMHDLQDTPSVYRRANMRCLSCNSADVCDEWLKTSSNPQKAPEFCRNKALFQRLERLSDNGSEFDCHGSDSHSQRQAF